MNVLKRMLGILLLVSAGMVGFLVWWALNREDSLWVWGLAAIWVVAPVVIAGAALRGLVRHRAGS